MFAGNSLTVGFLLAFLNVAMTTGVLMVLRTNNIRKKNMYLAIEFELISYTLHVQGQMWSECIELVYACYLVKE